MATRSTISYHRPDGSIREIYCHWDGYVEHNGKMLVEHYNSAELADALTQLGGLSVLKPNIAPEEGEKHSFDDPIDGVTIAYHRDRREELRFNTYLSLSQWKRHGQDEEYNYLFTEGQWWLYYGNGRRALVAALLAIVM
jgi:hypothetical protein